MAVSLPVARTAANCRWTQRDYQTTGAPAWPEPGLLLVCTREPGLRRLVTDQECAVCAFWEPVNGGQAGAIWTSR